MQFNFYFPEQYETPKTDPKIVPFKKQPTNKHTCSFK